MLPLSLVPLPFRQCSFSRRTLFVPFTLNHSAKISLRPRNRQAKPHMECGNLFPLSGLHRPQTPQFARPDLPTPIYDLRHLVPSCSKSSFYFPLFPLLPPVHSHLRLRVRVTHDSLQKRRTTKYTKHTKSRAGWLSPRRIECLHSVSLRRDVPKPARGGADASGASNAQPRVRTIEIPASPTG